MAALEKTTACVRSGSRQPWFLQEKCFLWWLQTVNSSRAACLRRAKDPGYDRNDKALYGDDSDVVQRPACDPKSQAALIWMREGKYRDTTCNPRFYLNMAARCCSERYQASRFPSYKFYRLRWRFWILETCESEEIRANGCCGSYATFPWH